MAILDELIARSVKGIITTHYSALKVYAHQKDGIINASMEFDRTVFKPTYRLLMNIPGNSFAIEIASNLGLPSLIIQNARLRQDEQELKLNQMIIDLERKVKLYEDKLIELGMKENQLHEIIDEYQSKTMNIKQIQQEVKTQALEEAQRIIETARSVVEKAVTEIKETQADKETIQQSRQAIDTIRNEIKKDLREERKQLEQQKPKQPPLTHIAIGDMVWVETMNSVGEIAGISHHGAKVQVRFGNIMVLTNRDELFATPPEEKEKNQPARPLDIGGNSVNISWGVNMQFTNQLDIRGYSLEQAQKKVDEFLSRVCMTDFPEVKIIHGLGNGVLKSSIRDFLKTYPVVASFRSGDMESGGDGVTFVRLK